MLLKQLPVEMRFNIHSKGPALCTVVDEVSGYSILPCISFYFYFWCMTFHTLHEYLWDNWSRIIIINKILCSFLNLIWQKKIKTKTQKKQKKTKQNKTNN